MFAKTKISKTALTGCFFIYLILLISSSVYAQQGFTAGFIIKQSGDTVNGFIKQRNSKKLSLKCEFKESSSAEPKIYKPNDLLGFRFSSGKYYISREYKTDKESKVVFMEYLVKGKANMFYFRDTEGDHYLLEKEGDAKIVELTEPDKVIQKQGYGTIKLPPSYKGKLLAELSACDDMQIMIQNSSLSNASLTQVAKQYHDCVCTTESCVIYEKEKPKPIITYTISGGYSLVKYNFGDKLLTNYGSGLQAGLEVDFKRILFSDEKVGFSIGAFLERDFSFTAYHADDDNEVYTGRDVTYEGEKYTLHNNESLDVDLNVMAIKVPIYFKYAYLGKEFLLEGGIGLANRFIINSNEDFVYDRFDLEYNRTFRTYYMGPAFSLRSAFKLPNGKALSVGATADFVADLGSVNQFLRLHTNQFTFKIGVTL